MELENFDKAMGKLSNFNFKKEDFAGNSPVHFLMVAGVEMDYFARLVQHNDTPTNQKILGTNQNAFGQNPLHVLNPRGFGENLIPLLKWFKPRRTPPGLLLTQRDIYGQTPLHALLQHPLPRNLYPKVLEEFPFFEHQLRSLNIAGQSTIQMMTDASLRLRSESESDYLKIQDGIADIKQLLAESGEGGVPKYGFNDIARGARGESWFGFFECRICNRKNAHSNSYVDQMKCACAHGRDRNAPDDTGLTPAHGELIFTCFLSCSMKARRLGAVPRDNMTLLRPGESVLVLKPGFVTPFANLQVLICLCSHRHERTFQRQPRARNCHANRGALPYPHPPS
jgi:hypothetical protein